MKALPGTCALHDTSSLAATMLRLFGTLFRILGTLLVVSGCVGMVVGVFLYWSVGSTVTADEIVSDG